jgi:DNA polymerase-3 subunit gamma/tau
MSYQVLARKWRPQSFETLVGQTHVLKALSNALDQGRLHHAYLLTGTRGVGKTTIARILARCLNCETGVTAKPCGECATCKEITEGRSVDLIEVDAASRTKVEDTRELLANVQYAPSHCRYKIYLIDEVHMLSNHSFNALLKTLEEPPPHVIFLFATTHPQKLPPTVLSRCLQFHLKNLTPQLIVDHLKTVFDAESVSYDDDGLWTIARAASGSMRDALSLSDQAIAFGGGSVLGDGVNTMLGTIDQEVLTQLLTAIVEGDAKQALAVIAAYAERAPDFASLVDELLKLLHRIAVEQAAPGAGSEGQLYRTFIKQYAGIISPEDLQLYYQTVLVGKRDLLLAPDPITGIEMIILRLFAFRIAPEFSDLESPDSSGHSQPITGNSNTEDPSAKKSLAESAADVVTSGKAPSAENKVPSAGNNAPSAGTEEQLVQASKEKSPAALMRESLDSNTGRGNARSTAAEPPPAQVLSQQLVEDRPLEIDTASGLDTSLTAGFATDGEYPSLDELTPQRWCEIFAALPLSGVVRTVASYCVPIAIDGSSASVEFAIAEENTTLYNDQHPERLAKSLAIYFGQTIVVKIKRVADWQSLALADDIETPADFRARVKIEVQGGALESLQQDENVSAIVEAFDGELDEQSIQPLSGS